MEQTPNWNDVVLAAGMAAVYNADDWSSSVDNASEADSHIPFFALPG